MLAGPYKLSDAFQVRDLDQNGLLHHLTPAEIDRQVEFHLMCVQHIPAAGHHTSDGKNVINDDTLPKTTKFARPASAF